MKVIHVRDQEEVLALANRLCLGANDPNWFLELLDDGGVFAVGRTAYNELVATCEPDSGELARLRELTQYESEAPK
jgi:hypothetical protein